MTLTQTEEFKKFLSEKDPELFKRLDGIMTFIKTNIYEEDYYEMALWPAPDNRYISKSDEDILIPLLKEFKIQNNLYNPVPTIVNDFSKYLWEQDGSLASKLDGHIDVMFENEKYKARILEKAPPLTVGEQTIFDSICRNFFNNLKFI